MKKPTYIIESHFRGDTADLTGPRCQFRRYVVDVYLEGSSAMSGHFRLCTDNGFLYCLGHVPLEGIDAVLDAPRTCEYPKPGLQHFITPYVDFEWTAKEETDGERRKVASIMMCFARWGMGYDEIEKRTPEEIISPAKDHPATADGAPCDISDNNYIGVRSEEEDMESDVKEVLQPTLTDILIDGVSIREFRLVVSKDEISKRSAQNAVDIIKKASGILLEAVTDTEPTARHEIVFGTSTRKESSIVAPEKFEVYEENGSIYVFYGDEQSAEMAVNALCDGILGCKGTGVSRVSAGARKNGEWSVLCRFGVMADTHVGVRYNWKNYDWLYSTFDNFEKIHKEAPLDFLISLGDSIDDGYAATYETDYEIYLEEIKRLKICDPVNPIDGRAKGLIPHYELCGNHDPIGGQTRDDGELKIRFFRNKLWYTENKKGEKVAHIGFFTDYGGYPLYFYADCHSYDSYRSYGRANDMMVKFVEESIEEAKANGAVQVILYNHFGIAQDMGAPVLPESGLEKIASVCRKYNIRLFFSGHEHDIPFTLRRYKDIYDYDVSMTARHHGVVEITSLRAKVTVYNPDGTLFRYDTVPLGKLGEPVQVLGEE